MAYNCYGRVLECQNRQKSHRNVPLLEFWSVDLGIKFILRVITLAEIYLFKTSLFVLRR
jgi:hypothetical protein